MFSMYSAVVKTEGEGIKMALFDVGRVCVKLAGRDAGLKCVVIDVIDHVYVLVDGETRRKKVNVRHLEPLDQVLEIKAGSSHETLKTALKKAGMEVRETKPRQAAARTLQKRKTPSKVAAAPKAAEVKVKKPAVKKKKE